MSQTVAPATARPTWAGRIRDYLAEMYPVLPRLVLAAILWFEIYFVLLLNYGVTDFRMGWQEVVGAWTVFAFLLTLRIADDFKDLDHDRRIFPHRPLASGRVTVRDLRILMAAVVVPTAVLNVAVMNNLLFFVVLFAYGVAFSLWFFAKAKIQPNLFLALVTHNPIMMVMNLYVISFGVIKYDLEPFTWVTFLLAWTMYFPSLIWEVARKIRSPGREDDYVTYSRIWGHRKAILFVLAVIWVDVATNLSLVYAVSRVAMVPLLANLAWITWTILHWLRDPEAFVIGPKVDRYTYGVEGLMVLAVATYLFVGYF
ncbi:UbiA prenyltransferase family protein [Aestuariimicrobium ganziense]|uniref:UbiA family prenyltransferase n=1 Tax=Aestuariimicrobium ganziense TaxID=2773677 RepID=UPI0019441CAD|nr:UbiA family prenyltransferase [Aestuariimicrobium ganziense]